MTMPNERTRSIRWGHEFLGELISDNTVDESIRRIAQDLVATYPPPDQILQLIEANAKALPQPAAEALVKAAELWALLRRSHGGSEETRRSLLYVERHFPESWIAESLARSLLHGVRTWLLPEDHDYSSKACRPPAGQDAWSTHSGLPKPPPR